MTQYILSMEVPWMISPSIPLLSLSCREAQLTEVQFIGYFKNAKTDSSVSSSQALSCEIQGFPEVDPSRCNGRYQLIVVEIQNVGWMRMLPFTSNEEMVNENMFDWSKVSGRYAPPEKTEEWQARFSESWSRHGTCPDPCFYEVKQSKWLSEVSPRNQSLNHYIFQGSERYFEILGGDWTWQSRGNIPSW